MKGYDGVETAAVITGVAAGRMRGLDDSTF